MKKETFGKAVILSNAIRDVEDRIKKIEKGDIAIQLVLHPLHPSGLKETFYPSNAVANKIKQILLQDEKRKLSQLESDFNKL